MTPQSNLMVAARLDPQSIAGLNQVLSTMNFAPGEANADNAVVPFQRLGTLHFARFVILNDQTLEDMRLYGRPVEELPVYLAFLCDFDGPLDQFLTDLINVAGPGLRRVFSFCADFSEKADLRQWILSHNLQPATSYVNWPGRTVQQAREEAELRRAIDAHLAANPAAFRNLSPEQVRLELRSFVKAETAAGRLTLTPMAPDSLITQIVVAFQAMIVLLFIVVAGIFVAPLLLIIRLREPTEPVYAPRPDLRHANELATLEDHQVTNQFSAMGSLKPGLVRRWVLRYILWVIEWTARHIYTKGRLARVRTIHFARWVFLDNGKRIFFASNYDGSLDSYMDDFINKVSFGLNVVFGNGIGYPSTRWLLADGACDELNFKYFLRRHELPTQVWYNAHPTRTAVELERNSRIRQGLEADTLSAQDAREWVQLL
jgi:hypothetical protein